MQCNEVSQRLYCASVFFYAQTAHGCLISYNSGEDFSWLAKCNSLSLGIAHMVPLRLYRQQPQAHVLSTLLLQFVIVCLCKVLCCPSGPELAKDCPVAMSMLCNFACGIGLGWF